MKSEEQLKIIIEIFKEEAEKLKRRFKRLDKKLSKYHSYVDSRFNSLSEEEFRELMRFTIALVKCKGEIQGVAELFDMLVSTHPLEALKKIRHYIT